MKKIKKHVIKKKKLSETKLTPEQELFCQCYVGYHDKELFSNKTRSFIYAYGRTERYNELLELKNSNPSATTRAAFKKFENLCAKGGSDLFRNTQIVDRVNKLFDSLYNNDHVDRELSYTITQRYDLASKVQAIREFNRISNRIKKNESTDTVTFTWDMGEGTGKTDTASPIKTVTITRKVEDNDDVEFDD